MEMNSGDKTTCVLNTGKAVNEHAGVFLLPMKAAAHLRSLLEGRDAGLLFISVFIISPGIIRHYLAA